VPIRRSSDLEPIAVTMAEGVCIAIEIDQERINRRLETKYLDVQAEDLNDAIKRAEEAKANGKALSIGVLGNASELLPQMLEQNFIIDVLTDQTSAHDPLNGYIPARMTLEEAADIRMKDTKGYMKRYT